jgi:sRNA-binding regulator protein Hfq
MNTDSTLYTIGTALNRARENDVPVELLVGGQWVRGQVVGVDGHGVVLDCEQGEHSVIRIESVDAVRIHSDLPGRRALTAAPPEMPGPRSAWA